MAFVKYCDSSCYIIILVLEETYIYPPVGLIDHIPSPVNPAEVAVVGDEPVTTAPAGYWYDVIIACRLHSFVYSPRLSQVYQSPTRS